MREDSPAGEHSLGRPFSNLAAVKHRGTLPRDLTEGVGKMGDVDDVAFGHR